MMLGESVLAALVRFPVMERAVVTLTQIRAPESP